MPDEHLNEMAASGRLSDRAALATQVRAMLKDDASWNFVQNFTDQWLDLSGIDRVAVNPPHALRMTKQLIREGMQSDLPSVLEMSASLQALAHQTEDHAEAVDAILARREPTFKGR